jgi:hypothetical protein
MSKQKHWRDRKGIIEEIAAPMIAKHFTHLKGAKIIYTFRHPPKFDTGDEKFVAGSARSIPNKERDTYGFDFELCVAHEVWKRLSPEQRRRLLFHELCHMEILIGEDMQPIMDEVGRLGTFIEPHDINIRSFKREIIRYGVDAADVDSVHFLKRMLVKKGVDETFKDETDIML